MLRALGKPISRARPLAGWALQPARALAASAGADSPASMVRDAHKFDEGLLRKHLESNMPDHDFGGWEVKQFTHGQSNPSE